jgi:ABC-type transport system substrate-binding protein
MFAGAQEEQNYFFTIHLALRAPFREEYTELLPEEFAKIGIKLIPEPLEGAAWSERYTWEGATFEEGGCDIIQCAHGWQRYDPRIGLDFYMSTLNDLNRENLQDSVTHYYFSNSWVDQALRLAYETTDIEEAQRYLFWVDEIIYEHSPLLFILWPKESLTMRADIEGYEPRWGGGRALSGMEKVTINGKTMEDDTQIVIAQASDVADVSPMTIGDVYSFPVQSLCYDNLVTLDNDYKPTPGLAKSWEVSDDQKTITMTLHEGIKWHDGTPFTSEDVKWTYEFVALSDERPSFHYHSQYGVMKQKINSIETPDENTIIFNFNEPHGTFFVDCGKIAVMAKHRWEGITRDEIGEHEYSVEGPSIGTGPYIMKEWVKGQYIMFEANEDYFRGAPFVDTLFLKFIPESAAAIAAIEAGEVDWLMEPYKFGKELETLRANPDLQVIEYESGYVEPLGINTNHPALANKYVRQALNYVIPRDHIVTNLRFGMGTPANQFCPPWNWGHNPDIPEYEYNIEKAKELMAKAGYDIDLLTPPDTTIPMSAYVMPAVVGLIVGIAISLGYVYLSKK